ncbi:MAG: type II toxin-antitoxin system Phd/YefM family antitoxin [Actinomycetota bacterium]
MRQLRNEGGKVVDRVLAGEHLTISRGGKPVARLSPIRPYPLAVEEVIKRRRNLPKVDADQLRADVDAVVQQNL